MIVESKSKETDPLLTHSSSFDGEQGSPTNSIDKQSTELAFSGKTIKVYKRRWYILIVYSLFVILTTLYVNTFAPIQGPLKEIFQWMDWNILLLNSLSTISLIFTSAPFGWLAVKKGLRSAMLWSAGFLFAGKALQCLPYFNKELDSVLMYVGQVIASLSLPIAFGAPTLVSATWFPLEERTTATAIGTLSFSIGMALGFLIGPAVVPELLPVLYNGTSHLSNSSPVILPPLKKMRADLKHLMYLEAALGCAVFIALLVYFPNKPPLAPSRSATKKNSQLDSKAILFRMLASKSFWLLTVLFALEFGVTTGWQSVMDVVLSKFNVSQQAASWLGTAGSLAGIVSGVLISRIADCYQRSTKNLLIFLFAITTVCLIIFSLTCREVIPFNMPTVYVMYIMACVFVTGTTPLFYELAVECVYPVPEAMSTLFMSLMGSCSMLIFFMLFMIPNMDMRWTNWVFVGSVAVCVPGLLLYNEKYARLDVDTKDKGPATI